MELDAGGFFTSAKFETLDRTLKRANDWITKKQLDVLNIETVVLPAMHESSEEGSKDASLETSRHGEFWHQFIRVWYSEN